MNKMTELVTRCHHGDRPSSLAKKKKITVTIENSIFENDCLNVLNMSKQRREGKVGAFPSYFANRKTNFFT